MRSQWYNIFADEKAPVDYSNVIRKDIKSVKSFLTITLIASLIANIIVTTLFGLSQGFTYVLICHIVLIVVDFIFLLLMLALNFRFKNSKFWMPTYLSIAILIMLAALALPFIDPKHQSMTYIAAGIYAAIDLIKVVSVIYAWKVAKKALPTKNNKFIGIISSIITTAVMVLYAGIVAFNGYFGQGIKMQDKEATLVFSYDKDSYTVVGKYDDGNIINIPNEFNGKPVKFIDASLTSNNSVKTIVINNSDVRFSNLGSLKTINSELNISCTVENYNTIRKNLFSDLKTANSSNSALLNNFIPSNVQANQVWVDFNYSGLDFIDQAYIESFSIDDKEYSKLSKAQLLYLMLVKNPSLKNKFKMSDDSFNDVLSIKNQQFLQDRYQNNNAKVLYNIEVVEKDKNSANVDFYFDDVHELIISNGNDSKAENAINTFAKNGRSTYLLDTKATDYFNKLPTRDGLSVAWSIGYYQVKNAEDFANTVDVYKSTINLMPIWTMNAPKIITFKSSASNNNNIITYGDSASFTCVAESDSEKPIDLEYVMYYGSTSATNTTGIFDYNNKTPLDTGNVYVSVRCNDASVSDLQSTFVNTKSIKFTINKKPLTFDWTLDGSSYTDPITYTGTSHVVGCSLDSSQLVYDDLNTFEVEDQFSINILEGINAGSYESKVSLSVENGFQYYYCVDSLSEKFDFAIKQKELNHTWDNLSFVYDGTYNKPSVILNTSDIFECDNGKVYATVSGEGKDAGTYYASVSIDNSNYVLLSSNVINNKEFTIEKRVVENPQFEYSDTTYSAKAKYPTIIAFDNYLEGEINQKELVYSSTNNINVGTDIEVECKFADNSNYKFADSINNKVSALFNINAYTLNVEWTTTQKQYNGAAQTATFNANGLEKDGIIGITTDTIKDVGSITVNVTLNTGNEKSSNYVLENTSNTFEVTQRIISANWTNTTVTYNAQAQSPDYSFGNGVICDGDTVNVSIDSKTDVDKYELTATIDNANYSLKNANVSFTINKAIASVEWAATTSYVYDGDSHSISAIVKGVNNVVLASSVTGEGTNYQSTPYTITVSLNNAIDQQNYTLNFPTKGLTITQKQLSINWSDETFTYNGTNQKPTATLDSKEFVKSDNVEVTINKGNNNNINAGTYTAYATINNSNYAVKTPTKTYTINKKLVGNSWTNTTLTYNAQLQRPTCDFVSTDIVNGEALNPSYSTGNKNVGSYKATVTLGNNNYYIANTEINYTINALALTSTQISSGSIDNQTYKGVEIKPTLSVKDSVNSVNLYSGTDYDLVYSNNKNVGEASVEIKLKGNYNGSKTVKFNITKAQLTPYLASVGTKQYDGNTSATNVVIGLTGAVNGEKPTATGVAVWTSANAGTKTLNVSSIALDSDWINNYSLTKNTLDSQTVNNPIAQKELSESAIVISSVGSYTYTGSAITPVISVKDGSNGNFVLTNGKDYKVDYANNINAGTASIIVTLMGNYKGSKTVNFTINAKSVTPSIASIADQKYTGSSLTPSVTVTLESKTLVNGTDYTVSYSNNVNVGTATVVVTLKGNYSGQKTITFKIVK